MTYAGLTTADKGVLLDAKAECGARIVEILGGERWA